MVLDTARPRYKESTTWLGMRGRDAVRKSTPKVNVLQASTIDFSQIQFIVNHNSQSDGQNTGAKSGMNLRKEDHTYKLTLEERRRYQGHNGILLWTKQAKISLWSFDLILEPLSWWKFVFTTNQENQLRSHPSRTTKTRTTRTNVSPKITCPALELTNIQDGNIGLQLQVPRGCTNPNGVGSELIQMVSFTADSDPL